MSTGAPKQVSFRLARLARLERPECVPLPNTEIWGIAWLTYAEAQRTITYNNSRELLTRVHAFLDQQEPPPGL